MKNALSRRTVLRGAATTLALPWFEAMSAPLTRVARAEAADAPIRMAFCYIPNGAHMETWTPKKEGADFELPPTLEPLAAVKDQLLVLSGLAQENAFPKGDGPGDHARSLACFLTGVHPLKTSGANIKVGVSVDQVAAAKIGSKTRLPSLELGCERGAQSGNCDSGYSCAYSSNISWSGESTPVAKEINPRSIFERLFPQRQPKNEQDRLELYRRSILDFVSEDAASLKARLGARDRGKLDEYLTSIREIERRIASAERGGDGLPKGTATPPSVPADYREHVRLMFDLIALAFQTDSTRVATFMYANEGSNRNYPFLDISDGHHDLSHHAGDVKKHEKLRKINTFQIEEFSRFVRKLSDIREGEASVLDRSMIVLGSGIGDGNRHNHDDLPILFAGRGGGAIKTGRHIVYDKKTPLNNLYLAMLDRMNCGVETLGDSSGRLGKLEG